MKILLGSYALKYPLTGVGIYIQGLMRGLEMNNKITKLMHMPVISANNYNKYRNNFFFEKIKKIMRCCSIAYTCLEYYRNYIFSKKSRYFYYKNFIYHEPCYILRPYSGIKICNVHDLSHIYYIECHPRERVKFLFKYLPKSIKEADHLITGSHFMRNEIINYFRISPEKITTIYHGVSKIFRPRQFVEIAHILARYGLLEKSYLLSVGTLEPRKNLERLIQAFNLLPERQRKKFPLVLVGMKGWGTHRLMKLINQLIRKEELYCLGYVSSDDLPYLYSGAYGFVYVSLYEGFGLPLLEAIASGIPTLTSNTSSMPEVVGDAALLIDPQDVDVIGDKLNQLLTDNKLRDLLKHRGLIQADKFSWQKCVNKTVDIYKHVLTSAS